MNAAVAAIKYAIENIHEEPMLFLEYWQEGEFQKLRDNWDNVPDEVFIGADPSFKESS